jgi:hypothetical protein
LTITFRLKGRSEDYFSKAAEGDQAAGKTQDEGTETRATENRKDRTEGIQ